MGTLVYAASVAYEIDDRVLAHVKIAISAKLRRQECFLLNWTIPNDRGSGRVSIWLAPGVPLEFRFSGSKAPELNRRWLDALERSSHGVRGMVLMNEQEAEEYLRAAGAPVAP
ncbi:DUF7882 family protein [Gryllotalpicola ginsengisoli]|uniref:DUF7882 family protein n=1 Tax=Gryllotalpicola ginsengisoli TaxID=444608 RepID=UPI0003B353C2|nr:hypothetical protein [Gryllotalpicola ginsengisoli]